MNDLHQTVVLSQELDTVKKCNIFMKDQEDMHNAFSVAARLLSETHSSIPNMVKAMAKAKLKIQLAENKKTKLIKKSLIQTVP